MFILIITQKYAKKIINAPFILFIFKKNTNSLIIKSIIPFFGFFFQKNNHYNKIIRNFTE